MSLMYVTLQEQKDYSKVQHAAQDDNLTLLITACSAGVKNYLKNFSPYEGQRNEDDDYIVDSNGEPEILLDSGDNQEIKPEVKIAVMYWVDAIYKDKLKAGEYNQGRVPSVVEMMLYPIRDPALA